MKILAHLTVVLWASVGCSIAESAASNSELSRVAAAQLERLADFPRSGLEPVVSPTIGTDKSTKEPRSTRSSASKQPADDEFQLRIPIDFMELFRIFSDSNSSSTAPRDKRNGIQLTPDKMKALDQYADKIMLDERVQSYMRERIKRDGAYGGYGPPGGDSGDSGAFISGLGGQLIGSVVGLASSASKTSSSASGHSPAPAYGPPAYHSYGKNSFSIWDFKKVILNTLIQAMKAIGGGVLALKGQLIKGSGFLVSTKGRLISSAGEAITGVGKNLAASAVVHPPAHPVYPAYGAPHVGYGYETPVSQVAGHDIHYNGPPPSPDAYHSTFTSASDVYNLQPGLLIAKPVSSSNVETDYLQSDHVHTDHIPTDHQSQIGYTSTEEVEHRKPEYNVKDVVTHLTGTVNVYPQNDLKQPETQGVEEIPHVPENTLQLQEHNQENYELYPPLGNGPADDQKTVQQPPKYEQAVDFKNELTNYQNYDYSPVSYQNNYDQSTYSLPATNYGIHNINAFKYLPTKPHVNNYHAPDVQIEISNDDITGFETHGYIPRHRPHPGLHIVAMQGPLKIPILGPSTVRLYKNAGFPPAHVNAISGIGKYPKYGPGFEIQQSIGYELRKRRDGSRTKIQRI